tara:strand:+ start:2596 stop:2751 length:156 start_codon:yes stop_codon:yes gene_type:complete
MDHVYDTIFVLKMHGNWSLFEIYALPIRLRDHFAEKLAKHLKEIGVININK